MMEKLGPNIGRAPPLAKQNSTYRLSFRPPSTAIMAMEWHRRQRRRADKRRNGSGGLEVEGGQEARKRGHHRNDRDRFRAGIAASKIKAFASDPQRGLRCKRSA